MRPALRLLLLLAAITSLTGCATAADRTWIHPGTGRVQPLAPATTVE